MPVKSPPAAPAGGIPVIDTCVTPVMRPCASTVNWGTCVAEPYKPGATVVFASFEAVTAPSLILVVVTALVAIVGFGYVPTKSPPAFPPGNAPLIDMVFPELIVN